MLIRYRIAWYRAVLRYDTNQAVQPQTTARGLKFRINVAEGLYYPYSENKGADQLRSLFVFAYANSNSAPARISKGQGAGAKRAQCQIKKGTLPWNGISAYPLSHMIIYPLQSPL